MTKDKNTNKLTMNMLAVAGIMREKIMQKNPDSSILELKTLGIISKKDGISMSSLAHLLHISAPSATEIINKLVGDKKIKRLPDSVDRRVISLKITTQGNTALEKSIHLASENIEKLLDTLSDKQRDEFNKILEIIINNK